jgi:hypothetical protein
MAKKTQQERSRQKLDLELDRELEGTFPASDPLKITRKRPPQPKVSRRRRRSWRHVMAPGMTGR